MQLALVGAKIWSRFDDPAPHDHSPQRELVPEVFYGMGHRNGKPRETT
jgi:hypothetical protein